VVEDSGELGRRIRMITAFRRRTSRSILAPILVLALGVLFLTDAATPQNPTPSAPVTLAPEPTDTPLGLLDELVAQAPVQKQFEHESEPGEQGLETRVFRVNPRLILEGFKSLVSSAESGALTAPDAGTPRSSPNPDSKQDSPPGRDAIAAHFRELFELAGISFTPPSPNRFFYNPATGVLLVRARSEDFDRIHKVLEVVNQAPPQVTIELRLVEIASLNTREIGFDWFLGNTLVSTDPSDATLSGILTGSQSHTMLLALRKRNGVKFMAAPRVTTLSGGRTRISMEADGLTATLLPVVRADGYMIDLTIDINLSRAPDGLAPDPSALHPSPTQFQISTRANIWDGQTMLVTRPAINHGRHASDGNSKPSDRKSILVFITPTIVDPAGNPVHSPASTPYDPNPLPSGLADPSTVPPP
jgi:type II secretory pathway component GspD/PulD (secretin)